MKMIQLPRSTKFKVKREKERILEKMSNEEISQETWENFHKRYMGYTAMVTKKSLGVTPDTVLIVSAGILQVLLISCVNGGFDLNKAWNFVLKARV